jgi:hypothetical protein
MKKFAFAFLLFWATFNSVIQSQSPQGIPYQAVVRDNNGQPIANSTLMTRFTLHEQTPTGSISYQETHNTSSNNQGLIALTFGEGTPTVGTFSSINWAQSVKFLQVETDLGNGYTEIGTQQLMSVPYALYSGNSNQTNNSGQTLSTDSVLTLYSTVTQSSCDFVVPEGEAWKVVSFNKNSGSAGNNFLLTTNLTSCGPNGFIGQYACNYTFPSIRYVACQFGNLILTETPNAVVGTGNLNGNTVSTIVQNCDQCEASRTFEFTDTFWSMPTFSLPVWCNPNQQIKSAPEIFLTIEKYK